MLRNHELAADMTERVMTDHHGTKSAMTTPLTPEELAAWDRFAAAALGGMASATKVDQQDATNIAQVADAMIVERRKRIAEAAPPAHLSIYIASKMKHGHRWRDMRDAGAPIISTWIDECGEGETTDWPGLWSRCINEASMAKALIAYRESGEILKGAWVKVGAALAHGKPVLLVGDFAGLKIQHHPLITVFDGDVAAAIRALGSPMTDHAAATQEVKPETPAKFDVGKTYPTRGGGTGTVVSDDGGENFPLRVEYRDGLVDWVTRAGSRYLSRVDEYDLLLPAIEPEAAPAKKPADDGMDYGNGVTRY